MDITSCTRQGAATDFLRKLLNHDSDKKLPESHHSSGTQDNARRRSHQGTALGHTGVGQAPVYSDIQATGTIMQASKVSGATQVATPTPDCVSTLNRINTASDSRATSYDSSGNAGHTALQPSPEHTVGTSLLSAALQPAAAWMAHCCITAWLSAIPAPQASRCCSMSTAASPLKRATRSQLISRTTLGPLSSVAGVRVEPLTPHATGYASSDEECPELPSDSSDTNSEPEASNYDTHPIFVEAEDSDDPDYDNDRSHDVKPQGYNHARHEPGSTPRSPWCMLRTQGGSIYAAKSTWHTAMARDLEHDPSPHGVGHLHLHEWGIYTSTSWASTPPCPSRFTPRSHGTLSSTQGGDIYTATPLGISPWTSQVQSAPASSSQLQSASASFSQLQSRFRGVGYLRHHQHPHPPDHLQAEEGRLMDYKHMWGTTAKNLLDENHMVHSRNVTYDIADYGQDKVLGPPSDDPDKVDLDRDFHEML